MKVIYKPRCESLPSGEYFLGYTLPVQETTKHMTEMHFDTYSDLKEYLAEEYGEVDSLHNLADLNYAQDKQHQSGAVALLR